MVDGPASRALPLEADEELSYDELIDTLLLLEGEEVHLAVGFPAAAQMSSRLTIAGPLRHHEYTWAHGFAVGRSRLLLFEGDFVEAGLRTWDGNALFMIEMQFAGQRLTIGDTLIGLGDFDADKWPDPPAVG